MRERIIKIISSEKVGRSGLEALIPHYDPIEINSVLRDLMNEGKLSFSDQLVSIVNNTSFERALQYKSLAKIDNNNL